MTDPTQPNPSQSKNFGPTNQPNPQPITQSNSIQPTKNLRAHRKQFFTVSKSLSGINHLSGYRALLQQSQEAYQVLEFLEMFLTHNPTQPNPWVDPAHGQLWSSFNQLDVFCCDAEGGAGNEGHVISVSTAADKSSYRSWVRVRWDAGGTNDYRRGHQGLVDVKCVTAADGYMYYKDHLLKLGNHERL